LTFDFAEKRGIFLPMFRVHPNWWSVCVLVMFAFGFLAGVATCCDDHAELDFPADHCALHCVCHTLCLPAATTDAVPLVAHRCHWVEPPLHLPAFAASIFIPPKA
jgi:hypothetical protein